MNTREDKIKLFVNELNYITDLNLRKFAEELIGEAENYFFNIAASTTGKYHPQFDLGEGGLVRHTRCVAYMANAIATANMYSDHDKDLLVIAALAHDIKKLGNHSTEYTAGDHPQWAKKYVITTAILKPELISIKDAETIGCAVESHMGRWGERDGMPLPSTPFEMALHTADYIASRKEILDFDFKPTENVAISYEPKKEEAFNGNPKDYVLQFGKHKGKTLEEIKPSGYLDWMVKQENFFNKEAQDMARKYLGLTASESKDEIEENDVPATVQSVDDLPF